MISLHAPVDLRIGWPTDDDRLARLLDVALPPCDAVLDWRVVSLSPRCRLHSERADEFGGEQEEDDFAPQAHQRRSKTDAATRLTLDTTESTERRCVRPRPSGIARPTRRHRDDVTIVPTNGPATPVAQMVSDALVGVSVTASSLVHLSSPRCRIPLYEIRRRLRRRGRG
jgi:hypothetical protein